MVEDRSLWIGSSHRVVAGSRRSIPTISRVAAARSKFFAVDKTEYTPRARQGTKRRDAVFLVTLRPKTALQVGAYRDVLELQFADGSTVYVAVVFVLHGDVYADKPRIDLGALRDVGEDRKSFRICYSNGSKKWDELNWKCDGPLSAAITIRVDRQEGASTHDSISVRVDQSRLQWLPRGFMNCRIRFSQDDPSDGDAIQVLAYGYH